METEDMSDIPYPDEIWRIRPTWEIVSKSVVFVPLIIFGIIGHIVLLHVILRNKRLRTPTNLLIANMSAADLATLLICPWMFMCSDFFQNYLLGQPGCKTEGFLECALLLTSVFNLCAVSYDRLTAIVLPCEARLTVRGAKVVMIITWVLGALIASPLIVYRTYTERQWQDWLEKYCAENVHIMPTYWHVIITLLVWLPLGVMAVCYTAIFIKLDRYEQKVLRRGFEHPTTVSLKSRVARTMFIIVGVFIVCRLPFTVFVFWRNQLIKAERENQTATEVSDGMLVLWSMSHYLFFSNAAINPLIYGLTNDNFKREFRSTSLSHWLFGAASSSTSQPLVQSPPTKVKTMETTEGNAPGKSGDTPKTWFNEPKCSMTAKKSEELPKTWFMEPRFATKAFVRKSEELPKTWFTEPKCTMKTVKNDNEDSPFSEQPECSKKERRSCEEDSKAWFTVPKCTMKSLNDEGYM